MRDVAVIGVGETEFGELWDRSFRDLGIEAGLKAIQDAKLRSEDIDAVYIGNMSAGKFIDQEHVSALVADYAGLADMHLPTVRVEGGGACGAIALLQGRLAIASGMHDIVVVGGAEKMTDVSEVQAAEILSSTADQEWETVFGATFAGLYAMMARRHMYEYGTTREQMAAVAVKNHKNGALNPEAQFQKEITLETVLQAPWVAEPLGLFDCAPLSVGERCAVEQAERLRDPGRLQDRLERDFLLELSLGIQGAILVILHRDGGHLLPRRAVLVHVSRGHHRVQAGERRPEDGLPLLVRGGREDLRGLDLADVRHLLRAAHDDDVVHPGRDGESGLEESYRAACAAAFDADRREVHVREARIIGDEGRHMLLVDEFPRGHVADVHRVDVLRAELRVLDRLQPGLDPEVPEGAIPQLPELRLADADDRDVPHRPRPPASRSCRGTSRTSRSRRRPGPRSCPSST